VTSQASVFVPPVPVPSATSPSTWSFIRAVRSNSLTLFPTEAYERDVWARRFLGRQSVLLNAPGAIHRVLVDNPGNYRRSGTAVRILLPTNGQGLVLSEGETWRRQRRTMAPALTPRIVPMLSRHVAEAVGRQLDQWSSRVAEPVDLLADMQFLALEIAGRSMFSVQMRQYGSEVRRLLGEFADRHVQLDILDMLVPPNIPTPRDFGRRRWRREWMRLVDVILAARLASAEEDEISDLFGLLHAARDPETGFGFAPEELRDQVATMILAGSETTALNMFWALALLAQSPDEQQKVAEEARTLALTPESAAGDLAKLPRTRAVVLEALRLYPPAYILVREAIGRDAAGEVELKAKDIIMIAPWVLHRHRSLWDRPEVFDPSRFMSGAPPPPRHAFLPFGAGPRTCIGAQFALTEATLVLASTFQRFRVTLAEDRPVLPTAILAIAPDHSPKFKLEPR
jgi:cytochrome P450